MFHIVLVEPEIPSNTGNIARLCAATRSTLHLIQPLGFKLDDRAMKRAGMDYLDMAAIHEHQSLQDCLTSTRRIIYLSTRATRPYWDFHFEPGDHLVFGRETKGLPQNLLDQNAGSSLKIPMMEPKARSLNLATSVGIVLFEAIRQQEMS